VLISTQQRRGFEANGSKNGKKRLDTIGLIYIYVEVIVM